jgi:hypothetical protein
LQSNRKAALAIMNTLEALVAKHLVFYTGELGASLCRHIAQQMIIYADNADWLEDDDCLFTAPEEYITQHKAEYLIKRFMPWPKFMDMDSNATCSFEDQVQDFPLDEFLANCIILGDPNSESTLPEYFMDRIAFEACDTPFNQVPTFQEMFSDETIAAASAHVNELLLGSTIRLNFAKHAEKRKHEYEQWKAAHHE